MTETVRIVGWGTSQCESLNWGVASIGWTDGDGHLHICRIPIELPDWQLMGAPIYCDSCRKRPEAELPMREFLAQYLMYTNIAEHDTNRQAFTPCNKEL